MGGINLEKRQFLQLAPAFIGLTLEAIADQLLCTPEAVYSRLKLSKMEVEFDGKAFEGHITSIKYPKESSIRREPCFGEGVQIIFLKPYEYESLTANFRRKRQR